MENIDFWRYQIINTGTIEEPIFGIHEVYFNSITGKIHSWTEDAMALENYDNIEDLIRDLKNMLEDVIKNTALLESELENNLL